MSDVRFRRFGEDEKEGTTIGALGWLILPSGLEQRRRCGDPSVRLPEIERSSLDPRGCILYEDLVAQGEGRSVSDPREVRRIVCS